MKNKVVAFEIESVIEYADKYLSRNSNIRDLFEEYGFKLDEIYSLLSADPKLELNGKKLVLYRSCFAESYAVNALIDMLGLKEDEYVLTDGEDPYYIEHVSDDDISILFCSGCKTFVAENLETIKIDMDPFKFFKGKPLTPSNSRKKKERFGFKTDDKIITLISPDTYEATSTIHELESMLKAGYKLVIASKDTGPFRIQEEARNNGLKMYIRKDKKIPATNLGEYDITLLYTKGEVNDFLDISDLAIIGEDRNIAEPLRKRVPTITFPGSWYNNKSLYKISRDMNAISITSEKPYDLLRRATALLDNPPERAAAQKNMDRALNVLDRYIYRIMKIAITDAINRAAKDLSHEEEYNRMLDKFIDSFFNN